MANSAGRQGSSKSSIALIVILMLAIGIAALAWFNREPIQGYAGVSTSYAARVACSCRFVAGRDLVDCAKDKLAGMEMVSLSENPEAQSVTASIPFVNATTATNRAGYGCVLESWDS
ncbi:hypothetical protein [uncultured Erythrobacter sp.]|uniref:hypothetical protein n=1 Tax=uncultured Erythrobacter sp. TaxID=263913 RepID=UPI00260DF3DD|nr:hypothetical protein [uncultured Erythrobacter sp.]